MCSVLRLDATVSFPLMLVSSQGSFGSHSFVSLHSSAGGHLDFTTGQNVTNDPTNIQRGLICNRDNQSMRDEEIVFEQLSHFLEQMSYIKHIFMLSK